MRGPGYGEEEGYVLGKLKVSVLGAGLGSTGTCQRGLKHYTKRQGTKKVEACVAGFGLGNNIVVLGSIYVPHKLEEPPGGVQAL